MPDSSDGGHSGAALAARPCRHGVGEELIEEVVDEEVADLFEDFSLASPAELSNLDRNTTVPCAYLG